MTRRILPTFLVALAAAGMTAGCDTSERPAELSLDDVQACSLISRPRLVSLDVTTRPMPDPLVPGSGLEGSTCFYNTRHGATAIVSLVTNDGIDYWTDSKSTKTVDLPPIQGYRTIQLDPDHSSDPHDRCTLAVDVADGQSLRADTGPNDSDQPPSCEVSRQFAESAVASLALQAR